MLFTVEKIGQRFLVFLVVVFTSLQVDPLGCFAFFFITAPGIVNFVDCVISFHRFFPFFSQCIRLNTFYFFLHTFKKTVVSWLVDVCIQSNVYFEISLYRYLVSQFTFFLYIYF